MMFYFPHILWCIAGILFVLLLVCIVLRLLRAAARLAAAVFILFILGCFANILWGDAAALPGIAQISPYSTQIEDVYHMYKAERTS